MPDWQEILGRDGPAVWRTAYRLLGNRADADECFQEAFLAALEASRREPVQSWRALLVRLAAARAVDQLRRRYRRPREVTADWAAVHDRGPPASQAAEDAELAEQLRRALALLPPQQAETFTLHCLEGWSYEDIARHQAVSVNAVGVHLHRARRRLRELLGPTLEVPPAEDRGRAGERKEPS